MCLSTDGKKRIKKGVKTDEKKNQKETFLSSCSCISFLIGDAFGVFYLFFWMEVPDKPTNFEPTPEQEARLHEIFTHPENYPEDLLEKVREFPEAVDFVYDYLTSPRDLQLAIDPEKARAYRVFSRPIDAETCTMCGDLCAVKRSRRILAGQ